MDPQGMDLAAQNARGLLGKLDEQQTIRLPIVVLKATVLLDLSWG